MFYTIKYFFYQLKLTKIFNNISVIKYLSLKLSKQGTIGNGDKFIDLIY